MLLHNLEAGAESADRIRRCIDAVEEKVVVIWNDVRSRSESKILLCVHGENERLSGASALGLGAT